MAFVVVNNKPRNLQKTFDRVKREVEKYNGYLHGDLKKGRISSSGVEGTYVVTDTTVEITILKKPLIVTNAYIEKEIKEIFREASC